MGSEVKDAVYEQWLNRPPHLMRLGLEEYRQAREITPESTGRLRHVTSEMTREITPESTGRLRHVTSEMNGLEKRYAQHLEMRKAVSEIREYRFEAIKVRLARATFWTPDFLVVMPDGAMELHESKGHWEDDARVKIKWAAQEMRGVFRVVAVQWSKASKNWKFEEFGA